ncbi:TPA: DNA gyrase subunit A, partial [Candidatus Gracilibacteria bacterium]|nr:DNA gyrase subunit A [Candidatus Gracilibacteria bacterium]
VRDGLKPVHRRILYVMHKNGLTARVKYRKSATVVGDVMGKYHPHGDSSIYEAMVRMAQYFSLRYILVNGQGNFGSIDGDNAAAMRYTEAKMQSITETILADIEKDTVDYQDNYDGSHQEPTVLPSRVPNLLLNGVMGIAVGMATNIPPHNLTEVMDGLLHLAEHPEANLDDIMQFIKGPDFPTSGEIYDKAIIKQAYATGRGSIVMRGKAEITETSTGKARIIISELPYQVNKANLVEKIAHLVREKIIEGVSGLRDESNKEGIRVVIDLKKDSFPKKILNLIYKNTQLQSSFGCNFIALVDNGRQPKLLDLISILQEFLAHRKVVITRRTQYELRIAQARAHILEGLTRALDYIDEIIALIRSSASKDIAREKLMEAFHFSEIQANAILAMRLQALAGLERKKLEDELKEKLEFITDCLDILAKPERIKEIMTTEFIEIKEQYGDERKTQIFDHALGEISAKDILPNEPMIVTLSQSGYIKRLSPDSYKAQARGGKGKQGSAAKSDDELMISMFTSNHNNLLYFTSNGRVFSLPAYEIPEASRTAKGKAIVNFLNMQEGETITSILDITKNTGKYLFFCTEGGVVKRSETELFSNIRQNGLKAVGLKENDQLKWVQPCNSGDEVMIVTSEGKGIRFEADEIRSMGRTAAGVRGIKLKISDKVVGMDIVKEGGDESTMLVVMQNGLGKITKVSAYRKQGRGGSGMKTANVTKKTGLVVSAKILEKNADCDLILSAKSGQAIRLSSSSVPSQGRSTQGVILMRLPAGDTVSSVSIIQNISEDGVEEDSAEDSSAQTVLL